MVDHSPNILTDEERATTTYSLLGRKVILTLTFACFVQEWCDVVDNVHLLHKRNHIGMSAAVVNGTQRQKEHISLILE